MMSSLLKILGPRKPYEDDEYRRWDKLGKRAVREHLDSLGIYTLIAEDYGPDIKAMRIVKTGTGKYDYNFILELHEVEVKRKWIGEWNLGWKDVRIPERKKKLLIFTNKLFFWVISGDLRRAWKIKAADLKEEYLEERGNCKQHKGELFFCIPLERCELIELRKSHV